MQSEAKDWLTDQTEILAEAIESYAGICGRKKLHRGAEDSVKQTSVEYHTAFGHHGDDELPRTVSQ